MYKISLNGSNYNLKILQTAGEWKEKIDKLERKNQEYEKEKECKICYNNPSTIVFVPCYHARKFLYLITTK